MSPKGGYLAMASHRHSALVTAPAAQSLAVHTEISVKVKVPDTINLLAGGLGGTVGAIVTCPLEVVKTRLQSTHYSVGSGNHWAVMQFVKHIYRTEGPMALWKGMVPTLLGVAPTRAVYFAAYHKGKMACIKMNGGRDTTIAHIGGAVSAGLLTTTVSNPLWVVKTRMQLSEEAVSMFMLTEKGELAHRHRFVQCIRDVFRESGVRGFYKGLTASYAGISETVVQFVVYERLKKMVEARQNDHNEAGRPAGHPSPREVVMQTLAVSGTAKLIACLLTYPHDVVRTRMREPYNPAHGIRYDRFFGSLRDIYRLEGVPGMYSGLAAHLARVVPNTAIMFTCYELVVRIWKKHHMKSASGE